MIVAAPLTYLILVKGQDVYPWPCKGPWVIPGYVWKSNWLRCLLWGNFKSLPCTKSLLPWSPYVESPQSGCTAFILFYSSFEYLVWELLVIIFPLNFFQLWIPWVLSWLLEPRREGSNSPNSCWSRETPYRMTIKVFPGLFAYLVTLLYENCLCCLASIIVVWCCKP